MRSFCTIPPALGAFYFLIRVDTPLGAMNVVERLVREFGVAVIPGTTFGLDQGCYLRVAYGALERDTIAAGVGRLSARATNDRQRISAMQIVAVQADIAWEDKPANFARISKQLAGATIAPGALVVLPEMFATGFSMNVAGIAEAVRRADARVSGGTGAPVFRNGAGGRGDARRRRPWPEPGRGLRSGRRAGGALCEDPSVLLCRRNAALRRRQRDRDVRLARFSDRAAGLLRPAVSGGVSPCRAPRSGSCWW